MFEFFLCEMLNYNHRHIMKHLHTCLVEISPLVFCQQHKFLCTSLKPWVNCLLGIIEILPTRSIGNLKVIQFALRTLISGLVKVDRRSPWISVIPSLPVTPDPKRSAKDIFLHGEDEWRHFGLSGVQMPHISERLISIQFMGERCPFLSGSDRPWWFSPSLESLMSF